MEYVTLNLSLIHISIASCSIVAYGFARFRFVGKKILFGLMISTLMLPNAAIIIPRYLLFRNLGWLNTFKPFWMPALLAAYPFFIFMLIQFLRGIPKDLDESAKIDGADSFVIFRCILDVYKRQLNPKAEDCFRAYIRLDSRNT